MSKVDPQTVVAIIAGVSFAWHVAMYAGILINRMKRLEDRVDGHERRLDGHDTTLERRVGSRG